MGSQPAKKIFLASTPCCSRRYLDASRLAKYFELNGCCIINRPAAADYIILTTCSYKQAREEDCFRAIAKFSKYKGELIVVGCLPEIAPNRFKQVFKGRFLSTKNLSTIDSFFNGFKVKFNEVSDAHFFDRSNTYKPPFVKRLLQHIELSKDFYKKCLTAISSRRILLLKHLGLIKEEELAKPAHLCISRGCLDNCAYCTIRNAVGSLKSKPLEACRSEYKDLLGKGFRKFVFLADNLGIYGFDINASFAQLLECLSNEDHGLAVSWEIDELHPKWAIKYQAQILKLLKERKIVKMMCAIQSGSDRILKSMNRNNTSLAAQEVLLAFKAANPSLILDTAVIIGFPSETDSDFEATLGLVKKVKFNRVLIHKYYDGYDTIASKLGNKIDDAVIKRRLKTAVEFLKKERIIWDCEDIEKKRLRY